MLVSEGAPSSWLMASMKTDLPEPDSPVMTLRPGWSATDWLSTRAKFSIWIWERKVGVHVGEVVGGEVEGFCAKTRFFDCLRFDGLLLRPSCGDTRTLCVGRNNRWMHEFEKEWPRCLQRIVFIV